MEQSQKNRRVEFIDELRGLCILLMVVFHGAYDLVYIFGVNIPAFYSPFLQSFLQPLFAGIFIFISGIACRYSRNNLRRGFVALGFGLALTLVTILLMPAQAIRFGILHLLGTCMILFGVIHILSEYFYSKRKNRKKLPPWVGMTVGFVLFIVAYGIPRGFIGVLGEPIWRLPRQMYTTSYLFFLGLPSPFFVSTDYFPLIPWMFIFMAGTYMGVYFREEKMPEFFYRPHVKVLSKVGKHTMWIYLFHQPVVYGVLWVIFTVKAQFA